MFFGLRLKTRDPQSPRFPSRHISTARAKTCSEYSNDRGNGELMVVNVHIFFISTLQFVSSQSDESNMYS